VRTRADGKPCEVCARVLLPGEPVHVLEEPERGRRRRIVCPLCLRRALARGWVRSPDARRGAPAA
jgi:hypothetical protein